MDISRLKKWSAGLSVTAILLSQTTVALAAYSDVPAGVWYEDAVMSFVDAGYLDAAQTRFRGQDNANRAEFVKLVVELNGGILSSAPATSSFDDVATGAWYYGYMEEAGKEGWVRGDGSCYGKHPCYARPSANINRAEATAIIIRSFGLESTGAAAQFVDNPSGKWYTADIQTAADHCVLQGDDTTGRVRPSDNMNRAEMVVMLNRVDQNLTYGTDCGSGAGGVTTPKVKSVTSTSATTVEVMYTLPVDQTAAADKSHYSVTGGATPTVTSVKVLSTDSVELTLGTASEAGTQYTLTVVDMMAVGGAAFSDSATFKGYSAVPIGNGVLEVTLSSKNPVGDTIPKGANGVVFTVIDLTAGGDDVTIENLTVLHEGFGDAAEVSGVYAIVDGTRTTRKRTVDTQSYTSTLRFTNALKVVAGRTVTLQIAADLKTTATAAGEHALSVELPSDFISNAKSVTGNFPLKGKSFRVAAVSAGTASISYRSVTPSTAKVGDKGVTVGKFEVSIDSIEDQTVYSMTIENDGTSSDGDIVNLAIKRSDGTILTKTIPALVGDFGTLVFDPPFTILEGDKITLNVIADINGGAAKNVKIHFDETGDVFSVGSLYGYGVNGQLYGSNVILATETSTLPTSVAIDAGQFTISINGPTTQQYTRKTKNAVLANVMFATGGEDVDVENLFILIQGTTSTGAAFNQGRNAPTVADAVDEAVNSVELRNTTTGRTVSGVKVTSSTRSTNGSGTGAYQVYRFDDFIVHGSEKYEFRVNFVDNSGTSSLAAPANGDRFRIHICGEATHTLDTTNALVANTAGCTLGGFFASTVTTYHMKIKGVSTNDRVGDYRPGGTVSGNNQEVKSATLNVNGRTTSTTDTTVQNAKDVVLNRFEGRASEAADILLTDLVFEAAANSSLVNAQNYTLWVDTNGDGKVDTKIQSGVAAQSSKITFDKITGGGYVIPKQQSIIFEIHGDISASLSGNSPVLAIRFATGSTYIAAEQVVDGTSLSGINTTNPAGGTVATNGSYTAGGSTSDIQVTLVHATRYTLRNQGDLYVTKSTSPIRSRQLLAGALGDEILRLQFHPEFEDVDITDLVFTASGTNAGNFRNAVDRLELYKVGASTPFATATVAGCGTDSVVALSMCAKMKNQEFIVTKGADINISIRPVVQNEQDGATGSNLKFALMLGDYAIPTSSNSTGAVRARGQLSSNTLAINDGDTTAEGEVFIGRSTATLNQLVRGNMNAIVLSKVTSITNADPNANGTAVPTGTQRQIAQFKFTAAPNSNTKNGVNKFTLSGVIFNVNATNVELGTANNYTYSTSTFKLYNKSDSSVKHVCRGSGGIVANSANVNSPQARSGALLVICHGLTIANSTLNGGTAMNTQIDPGSEVTFVLEANVTNAKISSTSTSTLQVSIQSINDNPQTNDFRPVQSHIEWIDLDTSVVRLYWVELPDTTINGTTYSN